MSSHRGRGNNKGKSRWTKQGGRPRGVYWNTGATFPGRVGTSRGRDLTIMEHRQPQLLLLSSDWLEWFSFSGTKKNPANHVAQQFNLRNSLHSSGLSINQDVSKNSGETWQTSSPQFVFQLLILTLPSYMHYKVVIQDEWMNFKRFKEVTVWSCCNISNNRKNNNKNNYKNNYDCVTRGQKSQGAMREWNYIYFVLYLSFTLHYVTLQRRDEMRRDKNRRILSSTLAW